jgi:hypothetical protein
MPRTRASFLQTTKRGATFALRYFRLWKWARREIAKATRRAETAESKAARNEAKLRAEIKRQKEIVVALQTKCEIISREMLDRVLEARNQIGISHKTSPADNELRMLRRQEFEDEIPEPDDGIPNEIRPRYEEEWSRHYEQGKALGMDESTIKQTWNENREAILDSLMNRVH